MIMKRTESKQKTKQIQMFQLYHAGLRFATASVSTFQSQDHQEQRDTHTRNDWCITVTLPLQSLLLIIAGCKYLTYWKKHF